MPGRKLGDFTHIIDLNKSAFSTSSFFVPDRRFVSPALPPL